MEPSGFRWLYRCHPWSSSSSITVGLFGSPHKLNVAVSAELLLLVSDSFFALPARMAPLERTSTDMCSPELSI
ncbi:hypothetical protein AV48_27915 [Salmonella enterica subsp. enterica serovar Enteritidis str. EC20120916]|nr:hypothetical protein AV48_27915 [Salmonella enterica subsp. enterica serovar Enteritidis str. EC20120916]